MNFNDTLTALARSMHHWPDHAGDSLVFDGRVITIDQWRSRRIEIGLKVENNMNESILVTREEMSDLDWLARNVHEWPSSSPDRTFDNASLSGWEFSYGEFRNGKSVVTKDQWFARRAELQNKPSWKDLPDWVMWISQGGSGNWWIYETEPKSILDCRGGSHWSCNDGSCESLLNYSGEVLGDHLDTLEKRPSDLSEQAVTARLKEATDNVLAATAELMTDKYKLDPLVSVEDAKITIMQSDGDVKHFGGIIGRSLPLEEDAATAKQPAPKGSGNPILGMVLADLTNRALEGKEKYGEPLLAHNGRNPLWDAYQEALDLAMYLRQAIEEQKQ